MPLKTSVAVIASLSEVALKMVSEVVATSWCSSAKAWLAKTKLAPKRTDAAQKNIYELKNVVVRVKIFLVSYQLFSLSN